MGTIECSQPASKSSWDSQDFGDICMVLKMAHFRKSTGPRWVNDVDENPRRQCQMGSLTLVVKLGKVTQVAMSK